MSSPNIVVRYLIDADEGEVIGCGDCGEVETLKPGFFHVCCLPDNPSGMKLSYGQPHVAKKG